MPERSQAVSDPRPFLVCAGTSSRGMKFSIEEMDAIFLGGATVDELAANSRKAKQMAKDVGKTIKTYTMINLVIGDTDEAAAATAESYRAGFDEGALHGMMRAYGFLDSEIGKENVFVKKARSGFISEHAVGSAETIAEKLITLLDKADLDGLMLIFPDYLTGLPLFAEKVLPLVRARFPEQAA
nr:LLM class flavin-dependent oxidoreductase [Brevundimonas sp. SL130]